jgi:hypothetical protein
MTESPEITDQELLGRLANWIVTRRLTAPAILFLETHRPLSFVGSQAMVAASPIVHFLEPFFRGLVGPGYEHALYRRFANIIEDRANVERLIIEIERRNQDFREHEREEKRRRKELKIRLREEKKALRRSRRQGAAKGEA